MRPLIAGAFLVMAICSSPVGLHAGPKAKPGEPKPGQDEAAKPPPAPAPTDTAAKGEASRKRIPLPLTIGEKTLRFKIPSLGDAGQILSQLMSAEGTLIDEDHMELQGTKIDLNQADGKSDYHIDIPTSIFDLKTRIISSDHPVVIRTQDFELTGERMRFDTIEKSGELLGNVHMIIHNLKQSAGIATP